MKWISLFFAGLLLVTACNTGKNQEQEAADLPLDQIGKQPVGQAVIPGADSAAAVLEVENDSYDFGEVKEGEKVEHEFMFTNTGSSPLIISNVQASCGCTTPEYSKNPIAPGDKGMVKVVFNSAGQVGKQHKVVTVSSNAASPNTLLHLRGEVKK
ncbi:hypothetical protein GCM10007415_27750 [Parapedobacter pyrenivorans]|uniref:DUF1573 domain-containing protein n=1 Tax=Parapedobacter pyrenivorans TaxID=1305674 RepID=A0A917MBZ4_9SPHI|nr:DUF1573 domain-containing protein [Parapedobacter pyrenivorans]GGG91585.1 hypothetical protein GCM10007415_27750 [Parapedobacter pyrenivorans]